MLREGTVRGDEGMGRGWEGSERKGATHLVTDLTLALKRRARRQTRDDARAATPDGQRWGGEHCHGLGERARRNRSCFAVVPLVVNLVVQLVVEL